MNEIPDGLGLAYSLIEGPDGRTWVGLQFHTVATVTVIKIDPDHADRVAEMIAAELKRAGREARRQNRSSIVVPDRTAISELTSNSGRLLE